MHSFTLIRAVLTGELWGMFRVIFLNVVRTRGAEMF